MRTHKESMKTLDLLSQGWLLSSETPEYTLYSRDRERMLIYRNGTEIIYKAREH